MSRVLIAFILLSGVSIIFCQSNRPQSECEVSRARAQKSNSVINLVPNCEPNGEYSQLQCHSNSTWCQCWDCPIGAYVPQCARNGGYEKKQCHSSIGMCWCVNDGGQQSGEKVRSTTLDCT